MNFKILKLNNIAMAGLDRLPRDRYEVGTEISRPDAILLRSYKMHDMDIPDSVLAVGRAGAGVNNIPVDLLSQRGVPVFNAPGANANAVKELVLGSMFMAARNLFQACEYVKHLERSDSELGAAIEEGKKQFRGFELPNRTLGVIGLGAIGVKVANAAFGLGMHVIGFDPNITVQRAWQLSSGVENAVGLGEIFRRSDIISVHVPYTEETRHLVSSERIKLMRRDAILLNFAREGVVDLDAVVDALDNDTLRSYVTDFPTNAIKNHPKTICLPHLGASTTEAEENCAVMVADNVKDFLENGNIRCSVNFPETVLERTRPHRLAIPHANVPNMVAQILTVLGGEDLNIADLLNHSRDKLSYTIVDLDGPPSDEALERIRAIDGILSVRVLPIIET